MPRIRRIVCPLLTLSLMLLSSFAIPAAVGAADVSGATSSGRVKVQVYTAPRQATPSSRRSGSVRGSTSSRRSLGTTTRGSGASSGNFNVDRARATQSTGPKKSTASNSSQTQRAKKKKSQRKTAKRHDRGKKKSQARRSSSASQKAMPQTSLRDKNAQVIIVTAASSSQTDEIARKNRLKIIKRRFSNLMRNTIVLLEISDGRKPQDVAAELQRLPEVIVAAINDAYNLQADEFESVRYAPKALKLDRISRDTRGKGVRIGVIDTDVDLTHPALSGVMHQRFDGLSGAKVTQRRHGTAVAGLIAARDMINGVAPDAHLLIARAFDGPSAKKLQSDAYVIIACLDWTTTNGANVVNMSFAGPPNAVLKEALIKAHASGVILVAAAGNEGPKAKPAYPAAYESTIAVTATDVNNRIYSKANRGDHIFVSAPGVDIFAPVPNGKVEMVSGTSFAAALVSGTIGLAKTKFPTAPSTALGELLGSSVHDLGAPGRDNVFGHGLVDAPALLQTRVTSQVTTP